jgi:putative Holliday junction resolvase
MRSPEILSIPTAHAATALPLKSRRKAEWPHPTIRMFTSKGRCGKPFYPVYASSKFPEMPAPIVDLEALPPLLAADARLIGVDLGTKTIGLALSDTRRTIASPLETLKRTKFRPDAERLLAIAKLHDAGALVIGLPRNMDGSEGPRAQSTRAFVKNLAPMTSLAIAFWDERLSTAAVTRTLIEADTSRKRRAVLVDKMAAAYILQGALDRLGYG